jgi:hypothetical protein
MTQKNGLYLFRLPIRWRATNVSCRLAKRAAPREFVLCPSGLRWSEEVRYELHL